VGRRCLLAPFSFCPSVSVHPCLSVVEDMSLRAASHAVNEACGVVYAVYIYGNPNDLTCPENFAPIISDLECKAAAFFMGFSAAPLTNALGPIADYTSSSPISNGLCFWERWAEEDRANITFRANQIQPAVDSGPLCTYGAPLSYTPSLYAAPTRHCRPDAPNSLRAAQTLPPLLCRNGSNTDACVWLDLYAVPVSTVLCVCSEARFPVDADQRVGDAGANKRTLHDGKLV